MRPVCPDTRRPVVTPPGTVGAVPFTNEGRSTVEILYSLNTLVLGFLLWDVHRGTREIIAIARDIHQTTADIHRTTDAILGRLPSPAEGRSLWPLS